MGCVSNATLYAQRNPLQAIAFFALLTLLLIYLSLSKPNDSEAQLLDSNSNSNSNSNAPTNVASTIPTDATTDNAEIVHKVFLDVEIWGTV